MKPNKNEVKKPTSEHTLKRKVCLLHVQGEQPILLGVSFQEQPPTNFWPFPAYAAKWFCNHEHYLDNLENQRLFVETVTPWVADTVTDEMCEVFDVNQKVMINLLSASFALYMNGLIK